MSIPANHHGTTKPMSPTPSLSVAIAGQVGAQLHRANQGRDLNVLSGRPAAISATGDLKHQHRAWSRRSRLRLLRPMIALTCHAIIQSYRTRLTLPDSGDRPRANNLGHGRNVHLTRALTPRYRTYPCPPSPMSDRSLAAESPLSAAVSFAACSVSACGNWFFWSPFAITDLSLRNLQRGSELAGMGHLPEDSMQTPDLFLHRAAECKAMAKIAREADSRAIWTRMAERWHRCAEVEMRAGLAAVQHDGDQHRKLPPGWSRH
jgi:hypothetical protein